MEPVLSARDRDAWERFVSLAEKHSLTRRHKERVNRAARTIEDFHRLNPNCYVAWSAGKDSTALCHLACKHGVSKAMSIKDDLDFPGEEAYILKLADSWKVQLDIVRPPGKLWPVFVSSSHGGEDIHSRKAQLSNIGFYGVIRDYARSAGNPGVMLGLRSTESAYRAVNRAVRGLTYEQSEGNKVCQPIADWKGIDVFAYLVSNEIPVFPVYLCCATIHPERIRKSWWVPGKAARHGYVVWLRKYWPSLFQKLARACPEMTAFA